MQLTYRGVKHDYNPPTVMTSTASTVGKYRGLDVRFRNPVKPVLLPDTLNLKYRGAAYQLGGETAPATTPASTPVTATATIQTDDTARQLMLRHHRNVKRRQQVMLTRLASEVGLTDVNQYWNHIQGKVPSSFWNTYDRSHAAMS